MSEEVLENVFPLLTQDIIAAIANRAGEPDTTRHARATAATVAIMAYDPKDPMEVLLAGQAVLVSTLITESLAKAHAANPEAAAPEPGAKPGPSLQREIVNLCRVHLSYLRELKTHRRERAKAAKHDAPGPETAPVKSAPPSSPAAPEPRAAEPATPAPLPRPPAEGQAPRQTPPHTTGQPTTATQIPWTQPPAAQAHPLANPLANPLAQPPAHPLAPPAAGPRQTPR